MLTILSILVIFLSPLIWLIRLKIREANKHHILQEYYYSRYIIELYMKRYFTVQNIRMRIAETHMHHWMVSPPSDVLIKLDSKHADHSDIPQIELLKELSKPQPKHRISDSNIVPHQMGIEGSSSPSRKGRFSGHGSYSGSVIHNDQPRRE